MDTYALLSIVVTLFSAMLVSWMVFGPFFSDRQAVDSLVNEEARESRIHKRARVISNLEDLEADVQSGKISREDYQRERSLLLIELNSIAIGRVGSDVKNDESQQ